MDKIIIFRLIQFCDIVLYNNLDLLFIPSNLLTLYYGILIFNYPQGSLPGSVVECLTRNPGIYHTRSSWFFVGVSLGKTLQSPSLVLVKARKGMNKVNCRRDMKAA